MTIERSFWKGKKVFLTGHTGFKGSWLSLWLQKMGAEVKGFSLQPPTNPSLFIESSVAEDMESDIGDVRDSERLFQSVSDFKPQIVFHMAAQSLVRFSYDSPIETYATNVMGTVHLLDAIRRIGGVKAIVNITSDKCYENREWVWSYREIDPMGGYDPYSSSKGCAELVSSAYRQSYYNTSQYESHGCALASVRAGNVIGGGDWAVDRLIPDMLRAFEKKEIVRIRNPFAIRPWQHVLEPLSGYLTLAQYLFQQGPEFSEGWNFGPDESDSKSVQWVVETLAKSWGSDARWEKDSDEHPHEANFLKLDCSKARLKLKWRPILELPETIEKIVLWHKTWLSGADIRKHTLKEIEDYMSKLAV